MASEPNPGRVLMHTQQADGHEVVIKLTDEQRRELRSLVGKDVSELKIGVQDLADIADLVAN